MHQQLLGLLLYEVFHFQTRTWGGHGNLHTHPCMPDTVKRTATPIPSRLPRKHKLAAVVAILVLVPRQNTPRRHSVTHSSHRLPHMHANTAGINDHRPSVGAHCCTYKVGTLALTFGPILKKKLVHLPVEWLATVCRKAPVVPPFDDTSFRALGQILHRLLHVLLALTASSEAQILGTTTAK